MWVFSSDDAGVLLTSNERDPNIVFETPGLYDVELTIACGEIAFQNNYINVLANPDITLTGPDEICLGDDATLTATVSGFSGAFSWSDENGNDLGSGSSVVVNPVVNTQYQVEAISDEGCSSIAELVVNISNAAVQVFPSEASICAGASVELTATGGDNYTWSPAEGLSSTSGGVVTANPTSNTTYTLTAQAGDCTMTQTVDVIIGSELSIDVVPTQPYVCEVGETINLQAFGAVAYDWTSHPTLNGNGNNVEVSPTIVTTYSVTGTDATGCTGTAFIEIGVNDLTVNAGSNMFSCEGGAVVLEGTAASSFSTNFTYSWTPVESLSDPTIANPIATPSTTTMYTLTVTDEYGCQRSDEVMVDIAPQPTITASTMLVCSGEEVTLNIDALAAEVLEWIPNGEVIATASDLTVTANPTSTTTYCALGIYNDECSFEACITIEVADASDVNVVATTTDLCQNGTAVLTASGAANYAWWPPDGLSDITGAVVEASPTTTTTYAVQGTDALGCTVSTQDITINVNGVLAPEFTTTQTI